jgi:hypothetical protein
MKQVNVLEAQNEGYEVNLSKSATSSDSVKSYIEGLRNRGFIIELILETRAGIHLKVYEDVKLIDSRTFKDCQEEELFNYLTQVRNRKMNIAARLMGKDVYTEQLFTKSFDGDSFINVADDEYYDMMGEASAHPDFRPLKVEIRTV